MGREHSADCRAHERRSRYAAAMEKPKLIYFDAPASRGEECRLALHIAGVDFEDVRLKPADWQSRKPTSPFGGLPILELPGKPPLGQSNAILAYIGRTHGLHPTDGFEAARQEALMEHVEDLRHALAPSLRMAEDDKKRAREELAASYLPAWAAHAERALADDGPFAGGARLHVVDLKIYLIVRFLTSGRLDYIPATILSAYPKLNRVHDAVRDHAGVKSWYARKA
jgi:glutathione S-transferase